jgi:photosystem II stability/assembly factor-like uncharacterized protein
VLLAVALTIATARAEGGDAGSALYSAAITVKAPEHVFLCAVTRAGNRLVAVGDHGVIIYSDDDGTSWRQAAVPVSAELTAVHFAGSHDGWAVGHYGVILHTADAGATWQVQLNGLQANQLTMAAAQAAIAANDPSPATPLAQKRAARLVADGLDHPFLTIWTPTVDEAMAFGAYRMAVKTTDAGKTWMDESLNIADPYSQHIYDAEVIGGDVYLAAETGLVFRSTDGGNRFTPVTQPVQATLFGILGAADGGILVYGVAGQAFLSEDRGQSWSAVAIPTTANFTAAVKLQDSALLLGGEDGTLYLSTDNGRSFQALGGAEAMGIFGLSQTASGDVIAVGNAGAIKIPAADLQLHRGRPNG